MLCTHCGGSLPAEITVDTPCPHCGKPVAAQPATPAVATPRPSTSVPPANPPPPGALPGAWLGLLASIAYVLKGAHPTLAVGILCLCAGLIAAFGARRRGKPAWPAFFTGLLPVGVALFFALLMLRPLFR
ncbi:hypothetical protein PTE30175_04660 [Pandoraea terrae]|uniref:Uncharacterized protein n=1 Tax=Pandoraea terrae TaxID=1537710 RepID=A0A5E4YTK6_9BURK|nr:hypothetical protein [Pandoraea terrae]VVE52141.1 hypothetical protein PTE30175_04660 [Pandoraea terrae]